MKQKIILLLILVATALGLTFLIKSEDREIQSNKIKITASFYPYYFLAEQIGGTKVDVTNITPPGAEPHDYEPTQGDLVRLNSSKLVILEGRLEPWASKIKKDLAGKDIIVLETSPELLTLKYEDEDGETVDDPHIWLSPRIMKILADNVADKIIEIDPGNADYYADNVKGLKKSFDELDKKFRSSLLNCKTRNIVTSHSAFSYLANEYGLKEITIAGLSPDEEPSLKELADVSEFVKENNIKYIFFETLVSPKLSETIANEVGAQTLALNPLEGLTTEELMAGKNYLTEMEANLHNLETALECKK